MKLETLQKTILKDLLIKPRKQSHQVYGGGLLNHCQNSEMISQCHLPNHLENTIYRKENAFNTFFPIVSTMDQESELSLHGLGSPINSHLDKFYHL